MIAIDRTALPMTIEGGGIEFRTDDFGEQTVAWVRLPQGADLRPGLAGLPGDLCQCPHWGYMLEGRLLMRTADGESTYEAGEAFYWAPGHAPSALEDCAYVDFSPTKEFDPVITHILAGPG